MIDFFLSEETLQRDRFVLKICVLLLIICVGACSEHDMTSEIVLIEAGDYMYPAKVADTDIKPASQIQVYIFNDTIRQQIGNSVLPIQIVAERSKPSEGWGTRQVAIQYFWNQEWIYTEDATEFEGHYMVPMNTEENRKIEIKHIRFPIPVSR